MIDDKRLMSSLTSASLGSDLGNPRTATSLYVSQSANTLMIQTTLYGLEPGSLHVTLSGLYAILEGTLISTSKIGRYARHIPELGQGSYDVVDVTYGTDSNLVITLRLNQTPGI